MKNLIYNNKEKNKLSVKKISTKMSKESHFQWYIIIKIAGQSIIFSINNILDERFDSMEIF